jgi:hypothetical protein
VLRFDSWNPVDREIIEKALKEKVSIVLDRAEKKKKRSS